MNQGKLIYITGGSSGIGLGLAHHYARAGWDIVLLARDQEKLQRAVDECQGLAVNPAQTIAAESVDVTAYETLPAELSTILDRNGLPDMAILSAGAATNKTFLQTPAAEFDRVVDINLSGSREVARALLPGRLQRGSGKIAFISSIAGLMGIYGYTAYAASKFAVTGMVQALRQELAGSGVSVSLVCPPEVNTPMIAAEAADAVPQTRFLKDLVGTMEPDEVADKIASALRKDKEVIVPGYRAGAMVFMARHFPGIFGRCSDWLLRWKFR